MILSALPPRVPKLYWAILPFVCILKMKDMLTSEEKGIGTTYQPLVPVIFDEYVDREFGTGCLKITPAHDINDYNLGIKYKLDSIDIFNDNGTLNEKAQLYVGEDRFTVRKKISKELEAKGHLVKIEEYTNKVGYSERTDEVIEPKLSLQWFMRMSEMAKPALDVVMSDEVKFHPAKFKNTYRHWMENVKTGVFRVSCGGTTHTCLVSAQQGNCCCHGCGRSTESGPAQISGTTLYC